VALILVLWVLTLLSVLVMNSAFHADGNEYHPEL